MGEPYITVLVDPDLNGRHSDIDLVVMSQSLAYAEKLSALRSLANIVKRTGVTDKVTIISKAKVPIVKFTTLYGAEALPIEFHRHRVHHHSRTLCC